MLAHPHTLGLHHRKGDVPVAGTPLRRWLGRSGGPRTGHIGSTNETDTLTWRGGSAWCPAVDPTITGATNRGLELGVGYGDLHVRSEVVAELATHLAAP